MSPSARSRTGHRSQGDRAARGRERRADVLTGPPGRHGDHTGISAASGEIIPGNSTITIAWEVGQGGDLLDQQIELSTDGGATYQPLALRLSPDIRLYEWDIPLALHSTQTRLHVAALDRAGNEGADASDGDFSINGTASIPDVPIDVIPPTTIASLSHEANEAGWHRASMNVSLDGADAGWGRWRSRTARPAPCFSERPSRPAPRRSFL